MENAIELWETCLEAKVFVCRDMLPDNLVGTGHFQLGHLRWFVVNRLCTSYIRPQ